MGRRTLSTLTPILFVLLWGTALPAGMRHPPRSSMSDAADLTSVQLRTMPTVDVTRLQARDLWADRAPGTPYRFAAPIATTIDLDNSGTWEILEDGRLWRLRIASPGAVSLNLGFSRFRLPPRAALWLYDKTADHVEGPYTRQHAASGELWTPIVPGDEVVVEVFLPRGTEKRAEVELARVNHGYRDLPQWPPASFEPQNHGACNNDVVCAVGNPWRSEIRSVAVYSIDGVLSCTGTLLNNTNADLTPYFLSAKHCGVRPDNDHTLVFYWNYEAPNCGDRDGGSLAQNQTGAMFLADWTPSDVLLLQLNQLPADEFNVYYSGWDATGDQPDSGVGIHHPRVHVKSISFDDDPLTSNSYLETVLDDGTHWRVGSWDSGTTEPGSSGSCIWNSEHRCVGQLHGGTASCTSDTSDWYGKLSVSWNGGGTSSTRLRDWLDPGNTGRLRVDGRAPVPAQHMVVLLDRTGSMDIVRPATGRTRCEDALILARQDVQGFFGTHSEASGSRAAIWTFRDAGPTQLTGFVGENQALAALDGLDPAGCIDATPLAESMCDAIDELATIPGNVATSRILTVSSDGGENNSQGHWCYGPWSEGPVPYDDGSWQRKVRDHAVANVTVMSRFWDALAESTAAGFAAKSGEAIQQVADLDFFTEIAGATGGVSQVVGDDDPLPAPFIFGLPRGSRAPHLADLEERVPQRGPTATGRP